MTDPVRFAPARPGDAAAMRDLARRAYALYVTRIGREPAPMGADYEVIAGSGTATLGWAGETLVAMMVTVGRADALEIENLAVDPAWQSAGVGSTLLVRAEELARAAGMSRLTLYTNEAMTENLAYYPRRGFVEVDRRTEDGYRRVYFGRSLA